jgi:hypothetical protein
MPSYDTNESTGAADAPCFFVTPPRGPRASQDFSPIVAGLGNSSPGDPVSREA